MQSGSKWNWFSFWLKLINLFSDWFFFCCTPNNFQATEVPAILHASILLNQYVLKFCFWIVNCNCLQFENNLLETNWNWFKDWFSAILLAPLKLKYKSQTQKSINMINKSQIPKIAPASNCNWHNTCMGLAVWGLFHHELFVT